MSLRTRLPGLAVSTKPHSARPAPPPRPLCPQTLSPSLSGLLPAARGGSAPAALSGQFSSPLLATSGPTVADPRAEWREGRASFPATPSRQLPPGGQRPSAGAGVGDLGRALFPSCVLFAFSRSEGSSGPAGWEGQDRRDSGPLNPSWLSSSRRPGRRDLQRREAAPWSGT